MKKIKFQQLGGCLYLSIFCKQWSTLIQNTLWMYNHMYDVPNSVHYESMTLVKEIHYF